MKECQRGKDTVGDHLCEVDKIEWVARKWKRDAALWYFIVQHKITTYEVFVNCLKKNILKSTQHIKHKLQDTLDFSTFFLMKVNREQYVIKEVAKFRHLRPELTEIELVHTLSFHFHTNCELLQKESYRTAGISRWLTRSFIKFKRHTLYTKPN